MTEDLVIYPKIVWSPSPSLRDVVAIFFRQRRIWTFSFALIFAGILGWGILLPSYQAQMKVLVRRGRVDPLLTATASQSPLIQDEQVTDEELNSEVELMQGQDILNNVVNNSGLLDGWAMPWGLGGREEVRKARAVRRLGKQLDIEAIKKSALITINYKSSNPGLAAAVLRNLATAYFDKHQQTRRPLGQYQFFDQQVSESRRTLQGAERQLMQFTQIEGVVSAALERDNELKKVSEADATYRDSSVALAETRQKVHTLEANLRVLPERATTIIKSSDNPQLLGEMKLKLLDWDSSAPNCYPSSSLPIA